MRNLRRLISLSIFLILVSGSVLVHSQPSAGGYPPSFNYDIARESLKICMLRSPDLASLHHEDSLFPSPYRFGTLLQADISPGNSGVWTTLPDGKVIWRATVSSPGALALSAYFDRFRIPPGGKLFIYNYDGSMVAGAYTEANNQADGLFSTRLFEGDQLTLEYVSPSGDASGLSLHINEITYAYRGVGFIGLRNGESYLSGSCEVNVNCPEGAAWQEQRQGVLKIHVKRAGGTYWCTGSLVNNTREDNTPYVLTANHCGFNATEQELEQWVFYFNYETEGCQFTGYPKPMTMTGAVLKAHSGNEQASGSDFYLIKLTESIPDTFDVFFNGWSRSETTPSPSGVCIHHPGGDLKKISTFTQPLTTATWMGNPEPTHWKVYWAYTVSGHGVTEGGSSGSPLFDNQGRIVGFLSGGESACDTIHINLPDYYGKFSWAWSSDGSDSTNTLMYWLDPDSTNLVILDGRYTDSTGNIFVPFQEVYPNPFTSQLTVNLAEISATTVSITVYDVSGRLVFSDRYYVNGSGSFNLPLGFLSPGFYFLRAEAGGTSFTRKIVRE